MNEKCVFCGVLGYDEMNCGMTRGAIEGFGYKDVNFVGGFPHAQPRRGPYSNT